MKRDFIEEVFSKIPKEIETHIFGVYNTGCGESEICVITDVVFQKAKDRFEKDFWYKKWEVVADDDGIRYDFDEIIERALKFRNSKDYFEKLSYDRC